MESTREWNRMSLRLDAK